MDEVQKIPQLLLKDGKIGGPFPTHRLKRVEKPTTLISDDVQRISSRDIPIIKAEHGDYGPTVQKNAMPSPSNPRDPFGQSIHSVHAQIARFEGSKVADNKAPIPDDPMILSRYIKRLGYFLKADVMGICDFPKYTAYSHDLNGNPIDIDYKYAIVIVMRKEYNTMYASTGYDWSGNILSQQAYQHSGLVAHNIADYIRKLGYPAKAQCAGLGPAGYQVMIPPLVLLAGLGEVSRAGIIASPFLGTGFKAAAVLTDLPLMPDKPIDFGLQQFCQDCKLCAKMCPSKAIPMGNKVMYRGYETWKIDDQNCMSFCMSRKVGFMCNNCAKVCPWTRPNTWPHNFTRWAIQHSSLARKAVIKADEVWSSHRLPHEEEEWWLGLVDVDGVVKPHS